MAYGISRYQLDGLGTRVAALRKKFDWTQDELARRVGVSRPVITMLEAGDTLNVRLDTLLGFSNLFRVPVDTLLTGQTTPDRDDSGIYNTTGSLEFSALAADINTLPEGLRPRVIADLRRIVDTILMAGEVTPQPATKIKPITLADAAKAQKPQKRRGRKQG